MKSFKIIVGILILYGAGKEYVSASKQLSTFLSPPVIVGCLVMILVVGWLFGSSLSQTQFEIRSFQFTKYIFLSLLGFLLFAFFGLITFKYEPEIITANGIKVNIAEFMNGSKNIIPDENERRDYCTCVVNKLTGDSKIVTNFSAELLNGKIDKIITFLNSSPDFYELKLNECMSSVKNFHWTETVEKSARENIYKQVKNSELSKTNNIDMYCDCLILEYKKLPLSEISNVEFYQSQNGLRIDSLCILKSKLK